MNGTGISKVLFKSVDWRVFFFPFSVCFFFKKKKNEKNTLFKKRNVTGYGYTESEKKDEFCTPRPGGAPKLQGRRAPPTDRGSGARPRPPLGPGRAPACSLPPTPPGISRSESEGNEECAKYRKAAAGAGGLLGTARGGWGAAALLDRADTWPLPPSALAAGGPGLGGPPVGGGGIRAVGVWPAAAMALGCIVVEAPEVLQRRLVTELVLVLRGGGDGGLGQGPQLSCGPPALGAPIAPSGASLLQGSVPRGWALTLEGPPSTCLEPLPLQQGAQGWGSDPGFASPVPARAMGLPDLRPVLGSQLSPEPAVTLEPGQTLLCPLWGLLLGSGFQSTLVSKGQIPPLRGPCGCRGTCAHNNPE